MPVAHILLLLRCIYLFRSIHSVNFFLNWMILIPLKVLDILGFFYLVDFIRGLVLKTRKLSDFEKSGFKDNNIFIYLIIHVRF